MQANRILFVDDDDILCRILARSLERVGFGLDTAPGPDAAMESARTTDYALILSDLRMPGGNGIDLLRALRPVQPNATMVLVSGGMCEVDEEVEVDFVLQKPWVFRELHTIVNDAIERYRLAVA